MPPFPDRYLTSCLLGRLDLIDIISHKEYEETVPDRLREDSSCPYQFIVRNPMFLEIPLKMTGQPGIYKLEKQVFVGVRDLLKKQPISWWPPKEFKLFTLGRFDLYPVEAASMTKEVIMKKLAAA